MDGATRRRGRPSTFAARGLDFALLTGDLALVLADAAFMASGFDARDLVRAFDAYSRMRQEVIAGQYLDWRASTGGDPTPEEARRIAVLKSGRYTIQEPLVIGALLVGSNDSLISCLHAFGGPLGEAFQIRDDLLGTFGEADAVGKPVDSDIRGGKRNLLFASAVASLTGEDRAFFQSKWGGGGELSDDDVGRLRKLIESSGARAAAETELERLRREAFAALNECDMEDDARGALQELGRRAVTRTS
jgi:geranylgeranyl diphosphate synthase type I